MLTAAANITNKLRADLTVTFTIPLMAILFSPNKFFNRPLTRSTAVRILYNLWNFLLSRGTGGCRRTSSAIGNFNT